MSESEAVSLEPCPFCATGPSGDHLATQVQAYSCGNEFSIFCEGCGVETTRYETRDAAIAAWNTRAALSTHKDEVARLERALEHMRSREALLKSDAVDVHAYRIGWWNDMKQRGVSDDAAYAAFAAARALTHEKG